MDLLQLILVLGQLTGIVDAQKIQAKDNPGQELNRVVNQSQISTFRGKLIYEEIPPVMSLRAYQGEEFFLISDTSNHNRLILRPSLQVSHTKLQSFHNQQVEITTKYVEGTRPNLAETACPLDADGQCLLQGEGYQVLSIVRFNPHAK
ncbi:hypothetical protein NIES21_28120 [Anabaenopsis circularis NIES-21]|uniref:Uncharacterized protein n=2 Tax=Nostocales TaxID=1161 RepID=A0A1Z4GHY0_9CYAN|nr:hypothetical protein [Nostoc cycadae]BAY16978.1 hypothetical protein NIES21_28120 [Anabaenopsis circularis NIES-21]GBE91933.1 nuclease [Nostoc cycadae WK-1]